MPVAAGVLINWQYTMASRVTDAFPGLSHVSNMDTEGGWSSSGTPMGQQLQEGHYAIIAIITSSMSILRLLGCG